MNRPLRTALGVALIATLLTSVAVAPAHAHAGGRPPAVVALPDGFQPEGIATAGRYAYFGSRATGEIYRADLVTGRGRAIGAPTGTPSLGLKVDPRGRLFVAGGTAG
ncbi:superoxide dismutase, partial [Micromonospora sp. NPDC049580]